LSCVSREKLRRAAAKLRTEAAEIISAIDELEKGVDHAFGPKEPEPFTDLSASAPRPGFIHHRQRENWEQIELMALRVTIATQHVRRLKGPIDHLANLFFGEPLITLPSDYRPRR
jgi:hypothetical protein